jgi:hypothetical protein
VPAAKTVLPEVVELHLDKQISRIVSTARNDGRILLASK